MAAAGDVPLPKPASARPPAPRRALSFSPSVAPARSLSQRAGAKSPSAVMVCYISNTPNPRMQTWDHQLPIYQQLADRLAARLLDGELTEGDPMPSVRALASRYLLNPLTVSRALQALDEDGLLETRRGLGIFVRPGARERLRQAAPGLRRSTFCETALMLGGGHRSEFVRPLEGLPEAAPPLRCQRG